MSTIGEQISSIEEEIRKTPLHKATEHYIGRLRAKLSRLKSKEMEMGGRKSGGGGTYAVKKQGDATVVLIGPPSAGKSTLINLLTNARSKVAPYAFTTLTVVPGMMNWRDARIQILDVPGLIEGAEIGKGRGREVLSVARGANLIVFMTDVGREGIFVNLEDALYKNGIRVNQEPPEVTVEKKPSGSIILHTNVKQELGKDTICEIASEMGIKNAEITIREKLTIERAIDAFSSNRVYVPAIFLINKSDLAGKSEREMLDSKYLLISAETGENLDLLKSRIWDELGLVRIYLVRADERPTENNPMIMKDGDTLQDVAKKIGEEFSEGKERAMIWGVGAKFSGQNVSLGRKIEEGMMVRFV